MSEQNTADPWAYVFNTPLECGLRSTVLLLAAYPNVYDLQRLVQYDYLVVHSGDVAGPPSMHPAVPHRSGELLVRRQLVESGLTFMTRRLVVEQVFSESGIVYRAGEYAVMFLDSLSSEYVADLKARANWVVNAFQKMSDEELNNFMRSKWATWGAEFAWDTLLDTVD